ncbi:MAG TPA: serine/threonine-protein kinase [Fontimonas sp.]
MIFQKHCPGCFVDKSSLPVCPHCGYAESAPRSPLFLPHGLVIGGQFRIGRVLGQPGGYGISYLAWDVHLQQRVAIKEYLPRALAGRSAAASDVRVHAPEHRVAFDEGLERFVHEARLLARLQHPNVVNVRSFFRAHGTAYLVMDYYEGVSLRDYLAALDQDRVDARTAVALLGPVLLGLDFVHRHGIVHRDIKPQNIYLTTGEASGARAILLDFGAARQQANETIRSGMAVMLSEGYAPLEQYQRNSEQGPATDVYGVAATLYRMITGTVPPPAPERIGRDAVATRKDLQPPAFATVLRQGLAPRAQDRYASAAAFQRALYEALELPGALPPAATADAGRAPRSRAARWRTGWRQSRWRGTELIAAAIVIGAAMIALGLRFRPL